MVLAACLWQAGRGPEARMSNHYQVLGVTTAATADEIRRAYRILARRYHPDLNPGETNAETFKKIASAYAVLSDPAQRQQYDAELEKNRESFASAFDRAHREYRKNQRSHTSNPQPSSGAQKPTAEPSPRSTTKSGAPDASSGPSAPSTSSLSGLAASSRKRLKSFKDRLLKRGLNTAASGTKVSGISLMEVSISIFDAIRGVRRTVELTDASGKTRKISAIIPPGVRTGSIVRFRRKEDPVEEVILVIRVALHPWLSMTAKGLTMEIPITIGEAIQGGKVQVPSLGDPLLVTVAPGTQSGKEVRLKSQGVRLADGSRADLFIKFLVAVPENPDAAGLREKIGELAPYYVQPVRQGLPRSILDE